MTAKHTSGPRRVDDALRVSTDWGKVGYLTTVADCRIGGSSRAEQEANACLIAAAPDMLEACREAFDRLGGVDGAVTLRERLYAAIAKAGGRE